VRCEALAKTCVYERRAGRVGRMSSSGGGGPPARAHGVVVTPDDDV
jgi:hypothetical protein